MKRLLCVLAILFLLAPPALAADKLYIDDANLYEGMDKTYAQGYAPSIVDGKAIIVLPLTGRSALRTVSVHADLGETENSPFEFVNISQTITGRAPYVFTLEIPLSNERRSGAYPVTLTAEYTDSADNAYEQRFTVHVVIEKGMPPARMGYDPVTPPETIAAGETMTLPANVFNLGRSTLRNVTVRVSGAGLIPSSSLFLGDIFPGEAKSGEVEVFIGMLSMTEGYTESYGKTNGTYSIAYTDDAGEEHFAEQKFTTEILKPVTEDEPKELTDEPAFQWWVTILVGFAVIAILVSSVIVTRITRAVKMR